MRAFGPYPAVESTGLIGTGLNAFSGYLGAYRIELLFDLFVASVYMVDAIDDRLAFGGHCGQYQCC